MTCCCSYLGYLDERRGRKRKGREGEERNFSEGEKLKRKNINILLGRLCNSNWRNKDELERETLTQEKMR